MTALLQTSLLSALLIAYADAFRQKFDFCIFLFSDDYNRVVLEMEEGVPDSDYINASYVDVSFRFRCFNLLYYDAFF